MKRSPYRFARADSNHDDIVRWYEELFCSVIDLRQIKFGCPDLLVGIGFIANELVECKTDTGSLEDSQIRFQRDWKGRKMRIVRTREDVTQHVQEIRAKLRGDATNT
jgi:hypothetical protein